MEGPSLVIAAEEFQKYRKQPIKVARGTALLPYSEMKKSKLREVRSWGKHFLLVFDNFVLRVHFLMFGSYRINHPRPNRIPKMELQIADDQIQFYSCAIKELEVDLESIYDWSTDLSSKEWKPAKAVSSLNKQPRSMLCDVLMDQDIFSGLGNIMKNEILFRLRLHPETRLSQLDQKQVKALVREARLYARLFYQWKKANVLKKNWQVFRKKACPLCEGRIQKRPTGVLKRISHFCKNCQPKI